MNQQTKTDGAAASTGGAKRRRAVARPKAHGPGPIPERPSLPPTVSRFVTMERDVATTFRPRMLQALQHQIDVETEAVRASPPICSRGGCGRVMARGGRPTITRLTLFGLLSIDADVFRCKACKTRCQPLLDRLGIEPGRVSGALARLIALLGVVAPYQLAAQLVGILLGVEIDAMVVWREVNRLGKQCEEYDQALSRYHGDGRTHSVVPVAAPDVVLLEPDGAALGMQRAKRKKRSATSIAALPSQPSEFREVKTGVLMLPSDRVESSPGRHCSIRRILVTCLGDADTLFARLWSELQELGWFGTNTVVVIIGDGAEWIWNRASMFARRCEILDFWHAVEHAWEFARLQFGEDSKLGANWAHTLKTRLRNGEVAQVIEQLRGTPCTEPEARKALDKLIKYYTDNAMRMRYDEYIRLGYGIGSGAVESAHKQLLHARLRQAGMRWSERGAAHLLALRVRLLNGRWPELDLMPRGSLAA